jgi:hypothetical protein
LLVSLLSILGFLVMGYHPGLEDDGIYLSAIQSNLNPALYPKSAEFFRIQMQATVFDRWMTFFVRATHVPLPWAELFWQFASLFAILWACHGITRQFFKQASAQWAGVAVVAAVFTLPVAGTALYMLDQHLHPRTMATALILLAVAWMLEERRWLPAALLAVAFVFHPIMAAMGISFCFFLWMAQSNAVQQWVESRRSNRWSVMKGSQVAAVAPLLWILAPPNPFWQKALDSKPYLDLYQWHWYEWLGAIAPLILFGLLWQVAQRRGEKPLASFALAVFAYGVIHQALAMIVLGPHALVRMVPFQPMRYLHLVYFFLMLLLGCYLGKYFLKASVWRWAVFLLALDAGMFSWQRLTFPGTAHLELPGSAPSNAWLEAFAWIRTNTPIDAYFALDPHYLAEPGEDYHSFRALAERSQLADAVKDAAVVTQVPVLGKEWSEQVEAQAGWEQFQAADFQRLKREFGVDWVLVSLPQSAGLDCRWHNGLLAVCRVL